MPTDKIPPPKQAAKTEMVAVADLEFDRQNPRLAEYSIGSNESEENILKILWDAMDVRELVQSIAASGFFQHEAVIVAKEKGRNIVIEGNRRLAAVKILRDPGIAQTHGWDVPTLDKAQREALSSIPVVYSQRQESWKFLGFKHVNGPAKWSSFAKAKYIADVHREYKIPLADIANQIGDRHNTVQRLYRGLMVLEQAKREKVYDAENRFRPRLAFSHLYTGLDYEEISSFIGLSSDKPESDKPIPPEKRGELRELLVWLYGDKSEQKPPVVESQNPDLKRLREVIGSRESLAALRAGTDLAKAHEISRPPTAVFEESLLTAKRELTTARGHLSTGYDKSEELLRIAGTIAGMADDIYDEMDRKRSKGDGKKKNRLTER